MSNLYSASQTYRANQINSANPLDLLIMAYDAALVGCRQQDLERTSKALSVLRNALDFNYDAEIALGFFRLYQYCGELARKGEYDEAAQLLRELRAAWVQVKEQFQSPKATVPTSQPQQVQIPVRVMVTG